MPVVGVTARLADSAVEDLLSMAAREYELLPPALTALPPMVLRRALQLAGGNARRLVADGAAVVVHNRRMW